MPEFLFYHLTNQPLEKALPKLLERTLERGWRAVVQAASPERADAIDALLWTYDDASFLPHGRPHGAFADQHPILVTSDEADANGAEVRFLVDGVPLPTDPDRYQRIVVMFDGADEEALDVARTRWREAKATGGETTYWQQDEAGRWQKRG